jgi:hypothetical protein
MEELEMGQAMGKKLSMSDRPPAFNRMLSTASSEDEPMMSRPVSMMIGGEGESGGGEDWMQKREIHQLQVSMTNHRDGR